MLDEIARMSFFSTSIIKEAKKWYDEADEGQLLTIDNAVKRTDNFILNSVSSSFSQKCEIENPQTLPFAVK
jgi:hypothetical protein